jgi:hypothetical protein
MVEIKCLDEFITNIEQPLDAIKTPISDCEEYLEVPQTKASPNGICSLHSLSSTVCHSRHHIDCSR